MSGISVGKVLLAVDVAGLLFGAIMADMGPTHQGNPNWPPHAKFHNAQTITMSVMLGLATMWYAFRGAATPELKREYMGAAAFTGSIYWVAGLCAILFPGTMGLDPEFGGPGFPQGPLFSGLALAGLAGCWLEARGA